MKPRPPAPSAARLPLVLVLGLAATWPLAARAYRPFDSTDAQVASKGEVEIELGPLGYLVQGPDRSLVAPSVVLNWGFANRWETVLEGRHFVHLGSDIREPRLRVEDTAFSLKYVLREGSLQDKAGLSVATEFGALLPTVNGDPGVGAEGALIVSRRWLNLTVHVNGAAAWTRAHQPAAFGGIIVEGHDSWTVHPVTELFVESERTKPTAVSALLGAIWRASDPLSLDAAVRLARAGDVTTTEIRLGVTLAVGVGFPR